jgi:hypothetical protein
MVRGYKISGVNTYSPEARGNAFGGAFPGGLGDIGVALPFNGSTRPCPGPGPACYVLS